MDDIAWDYVSMGITEEEDIKECLHCGASIMPWQLMCGGCGSGSPFTPKPPMLWTCFMCGFDDHESEYDAEECCMINRDV